MPVSFVCCKRCSDHKLKVVRQHANKSWHTHRGARSFQLSLFACSLGEVLSSAKPAFVSVGGARARKKYGSINADLPNL